MKASMRMRFVALALWLCMVPLLIIAAVTLPFIIFFTETDL